MALPKLSAAEPTPATPPVIDIHFHHNSAGAPAPGSKAANDPTMVAIGKRNDAEVVTHQSNVPAAYRSAEAQAGFVYRTDARAADVTVVAIPPEVNVIADYPIAVVAGAPARAMPAPNGKTPARK